MARTYSALVTFNDQGEVVGLTLHGIPENVETRDKDQQTINALVVKGYGAKK